jgi:hypothetical protein
MPVPHRVRRHEHEEADGPGWHPDQDLGRQQDLIKTAIHSILVPWALTASRSCSSPTSFSMPRGGCNGLVYVAFCFVCKNLADVIFIDLSQGALGRRTCSLISASGRSYA